MTSSMRKAYRRRLVATAAGLCGIMTGVAQAAPLSDAAERFGALDEVVSISLSPDGKQIAVVAPSGSRTTDMWIAAIDGSTPPRTFVKNAREPQGLIKCEWGTNVVVVCRVGGVVDIDGDPYNYSSLLTLDTATGKSRVLGQKRTSSDHYYDLRGGQIIDWNGKDEASVLMTRSYVPNVQTGSRMGNSKEGLGLDSVNLLTGRAQPVESPSVNVSEYISDGRGTVRVRGVDVWAGPLATSRTIYYYRTQASKKWETIGTYDWMSKEGFNPVAVDPLTDRAVGLERIDGRMAAVALSLDGKNTRTVLMKHPQVDVDGYVLAGRQDRVVGVSYVTDYRHIEYSDPLIAGWAQSLAKALPGRSLAFVDTNSDESQWLVFASSDSDPGQYYLFDVATLKLRPLLEARPKLAGVAMSAMKPVQYAARDGVQIPGYLTLPPGRDSVKGLPAIVMPHGGPGSRDEWGFDWLVQFLAHSGYAVLQPNFRGSTGYGQDWFAKNAYQSWPLAIGDVVDGGRWLVEQGARADGLNIVGWSYGGYAALQSAAVAPDLFKRVVAIAPVTDLARLRQDSAGTASSRVIRDLIGEGPHIAEGSPAQRARDIKAPVLMFHGDIDVNVNIQHARSMRGALESAGKRVELIEYKDFDHQLEDSAVRTDMLRRTATFLAK